MPKEYNLLSILEEMEMDQVKVETKPAEVAPSYKKGEIPPVVKELMGSRVITDFLNVLSKIRGEQIALNVVPMENSWDYNTDCEYMGRFNIPTPHGYKMSQKGDVVYFDDYNVCWKIGMMIELDTYSVSFPDKPKKVSTVQYFNDKGLNSYYCYLLNSNEDMWDRVEKLSPYLAKWGREKVFNCPANLLLAPQLEQLDKAGYQFAIPVINEIHRYRDSCVGRWSRTNQPLLDKFNRLTKPGSNFKEIFKCSKTLYQTLKDERNLEYWDSYRRMEKTGKLNKDTLVQCVDARYADCDLKKINSILAKEYQGKKVFTFTSLQNYLVRLDMFQAIPRRDAFDILNDYLSMCSQLNMEPRIDSDSLKREHDIAARIMRDRRDEIMDEKMRDKCGYLKANNYSEDIYFIRGIESYTDLIDEAKQQHNCVAGYANSICSRKSLIYVMREVKNPDNSLITVELSSDQKTIRQKYLAYNRPIHNKAQSEFLDRWLKAVKRRVETGADAIA